MGDYVGLRIKVLLKPDLPGEVIDVLRVMAMQVDEGLITDLPNHSLFTNEGCCWSSVLCMQSFYQEEYRVDQPPPEERFAMFGDYWLLNTSSGPKYGRGLHEFLSWIQPYVDPSEYGKLVGDYKSEYTNNPTFFSFTEDGIGEITPQTYPEIEY